MINKKLEEILLNDDIEEGFYEDELGRPVLGHFFKYRGFEIKDKERVMYSRNPIKGIIQEVSTLLKIKNVPPTEYICSIVKVPHKFFNNLKHKGLRTEYPTDLQEGKKEELQDEALRQVFRKMSIEIEEFLSKQNDK